MPHDDAEFNSLVGRLASSIAGSGPGDRAALRRLVPDHGCPAFWRLYHGLDIGSRNERPERWEVAMQAIAILTPTRMEAPRSSDEDEGQAHPLGAALHAAGVSPLRMARLLATATADARNRSLVRYCRMLARTGLRVDLRELVGLIVGRRPERQLRRLADSYYAAEARAERATTEQQKETEDA